VTKDSLRPITDVLTQLPHVEVDAASAVAARQGKRLELDVPDGRVLLVGPEGAVGVFSCERGAVRAETVVGQAND
jgi:hypothetical protein